MQINQKYTEALDRIYPENNKATKDVSQRDVKIQEYVDNIFLKGSCFYEKAAYAASGLNSVYRALWTPYYILKCPGAFRMKLTSTSAEKNLEVLANITAENAMYSVMPPAVFRAVPRLGLSKKSQSSITNWISNAAFVFPLIHAPIMNTVKCTWQSSGVNSFEVAQILKDFGYCLQENTKIYQGPEAVVGVVTAVALGFFLKTTLTITTSTIFKDWDASYRYNSLERIYSDVAMHLKDRWDQAKKDNDPKEIANLKSIANKITSGIDLIGNSLTLAALTPQQITRLKEMLNWSAKYISTV